MSTPVTSALPAEIESRRAEIAEICARFGVRRLELLSLNRSRRLLYAAWVGQASQGHTA